MAGIATGIVIAIGGDAASVETIAGCVETVIGTIMSLASVIVYIMAESKIDAASAGSISRDLTELVEAAKLLSETVNAGDEREDGNKSSD